MASPLHILDTASAEHGRDGLVRALSSARGTLDATSPLVAAPLVLDAALARTVRTAAVEIATRAAALAHEDELRACVPRGYEAPREALGAHPRVMQIDFALVRGARGWEPRLVELQAFPTVVAMMLALGRHQQTSFDVRGLRFVDSEARLVELLRRCCRGEGDTALVEVDARSQKTYADLLATSELLDVPIEELADLEPRADGRVASRRTGRSYRHLLNRVVPEQADAGGLGDRLRALVASGVGWFEHPAWYFLVSKRTLPLLDHPFVPESRLVRDVRLASIDPSEWVLKPLFSYGGRGVSVGPSRAELRAADGDAALLQRRIAYEPIVATPAGPRYAELRVNVFWPDSAAPVPALVYARLGSGPRLNVGVGDRAWSGGALVWDADPTTAASREPRWSATGARRRSGRVLARA